MSRKSVPWREDCRRFRLPSPLILPPIKQSSSSINETSHTDSGGYVVGVLAQIELKRRIASRLLLLNNSRRERRSIHRGSSLAGNEGTPSRTC
jgi:hypothetical protein